MSVPQHAVRPLRRISPFVTVAVAALALAAAYAAGSSAGPSVARAADATTPATSTDTVDVQGTGQVTGTPDVLRLSIALETTDTDVSKALTRNNQSVAQVRDTLSADGVLDKDVQTADLSIYPDYTDKGTVRGYRASQSLSVALRDLRKAGKVISDAVRAGGDAARLQGVSFSLEDNAALLTQARTAAFADAKAKAEQYAQLTGRSLGAVRHVTESTSAGPTPFPMARDSAASAGSSISIDPGTSSVGISVAVVWELK